LEKPEQPIFNSVSCGQSTFKLGNVMFIQGNFTHPDTQTQLQQLHAEVEKFLEKEPVTEDEFQRALKKLKVDFAETSETSSGIAETVGESITVVGDLGHYIDYLDTLNSLELETVRTVAKKYLQLDKAYTSVLVPAHA
jgi:predicted Zn-dependent peptidase